MYKYKGTYERREKIEKIESFKAQNLGIKPYRDKK